MASTVAGECEGQIAGQGCVGCILPVRVHSQGRGRACMRRGNAIPGFKSLGPWKTRQIARKEGYSDKRCLV